MFPKTFDDSIEDKPNLSFANIFRKDLAYGELNDNLLIIGTGILCKMHVYTNLMNEYAQDLEFYQCCEHLIPRDLVGIDKLEFYTKSWELYKDSLTKYYPFFSHYN
jgi:hypothetical protein